MIQEDFSPVKLRVDSGWGEPSYMDRLAFAMTNNPDAVVADLEGRKAIVDYARKIGMVVTVADPEGWQPDEYLMRGLHKTRQEEESEVMTAVPDVLIPPTVAYDAYSQAPHFPVLAKAKGASGGRGKYLLEEPDQWYKFDTWMNGGRWRQADERVMQAYEALRLDLAAAAPGTPEAVVLEARVKRQQKRIEEYEYPMSALANNLIDLYEYQQFINTPSDRYTSYRILVSANGTILAGSLYCSAATKNDSALLTDPQRIENLGSLGTDLSDFLVNPASLVYLGAKKILSNQSQGGNGIVLGPTAASKPMTESDRPILLAHGINPDNPKIPPEIADKSRIIGQTLGPRHGIVMGIDWLQEEGTNNFYCLEKNRGPGPVAYADAHLGGVADDPFQIINARLEMEKAALHSLMA
jgi:hypothetical protein